MAQSASCPSDERLSDLLAGQLEIAVEQDTLTHLDTCVVCQQRLEELAGSDEILLARLSVLSNSGPSSNALRQALHQAKRESFCTGIQAGKDAGLPFLHAAADTDCLGHIGPYKVLEVIGRGGMGIVLKARDPALRRLAAVKVLLPQIAANETARQRFLREARAAAAINHENVVTIYAVDEFQGFPFLVMELVDGVSLQEHLRIHGPMAISDVVGIGVQIANGIAAAHTCGVIHRDIKPANVLLKTVDGRVKITDFGLAHVVDDLPITQSGFVAGTPPYMSPEQAQGQPVDSRSDLFSLGCVLYAMCTGHSPFQGRTTVDTIRRVCDESPFPIRRANAQVPESLAAIVDRLLSKTPAARFQSAGEVAVALQQSANSSGQAASGFRNAVEPGTQPFRSASCIGSESVNTAASIAVLPFDNMSSDHENEYFSDGLAEDLITALARVPTLSVAARTSAFQFKGQALDVRDVGQRLGVRTVLEGSVRKAGNRIRITAQLLDVASGFHLWSERYDRELDDVFAVQDEIARTIVEQLKVTLAGTSDAHLVKRYTDDVDAYSRYLRGRFHWNKREPASLQRAIGYYDQALAIDPDYAVALAGKADCDVLLADYALTDQQQALTSAKQCATRALAIDDTLAEAHKSMGFVLACQDHDWESAERHFLRAIELDSLSAEIRLAFALAVLVPLGRFDEALRHARRAAELDPVTPMIVAGPAVVRTYGRQYEDARLSFEDALELEPSNPVVNLWSSVLWIELREYDRAMSAVEHARPFELLAKETEAIVQARAGNRAKAAGLLAELQTEAEHGRREATLSVARIAAALGDQDDALNWLARAVQEGVVATVLLAVDPCYDAIRKNMRFGKLLQKLHLL